MTRGIVWGVIIELIMIGIVYAVYKALEVIT